MFPSFHFNKLQPKINVMPLKYKIIPDLNLIINYWSGRLTFDEIITSKLAQINDMQWNQKYNIISDIRNADFDHVEELSIRFIDFLSRHKRFKYKIKYAFLTQTPCQVVFQKLLELHKTHEILFQSESFSTHKALYCWLNIGTNKFDRINKVITDFEFGKGKHGAGSSKNS